MTDTIFNYEFFNKKSNIREATKKDYINKLKMIEKLLKDADISGELNSISEEIIKLIEQKYTNLNTRGNYFSALIKYYEVSGMIKGRGKRVAENKKTYELLKTKTKSSIKDFQAEERKEPEAVSATKNDFEKKLQEMIDNAVSLKENEIDDLNEYSLITLIATMPRRINDWKIMKYAKTLKDAKDKNFNYMVIPATKRGKYSLIFNMYKTSKSMGQQRFFIKDEKIKQIMRNIVAGKEEGDFIYGKTLMSLSTAIKNRTALRFGTSLTITDLRKLHSTTKFSSIMKELEEDSRLLGHSAGTKIKYYVF